MNKYQNALLDAITKFQKQNKNLSEHDILDIKVLEQLVGLAEQTSFELKDNINSRLEQRRSRDISWLRYFRRDKLINLINKVHKNRQFSIEELIKLDKEVSALLYKKIKGLQSQCLDLKRQHAELVVEVTRLESDAEVAAGYTVIKKLNEAESIIADKEEQIDSLQRDIHARDKLIKQCEHELQLARKERDQSNLSVKRLFTDSQQNKKKISELELKNQQLKSTIDTLVIEMREVKQGQMVLSSSAPS